MFRGKVALITGSSKGIGAATAIEFAKEGANIVVHGRQENDIAKMAKLCREQGVEALEIAQDLLETDKAGVIVEKTVKKFSRLDFLINNAATNKSEAVKDVQPEFFDEIFKLNLYAPFFLSKAALPHLQKTKGCIVNVSSALGLRVASNFVPYCMAKSALDMFSRGFSNELAAEGIRVNSINPAVVNTELFQSISEETKKRALSWQPMGVVSCEEVAKGITFLCSSPRLTGTTLCIDGGFYNFIP